MKFDEPPEVMLQQCRDVIDQHTTGSQHDNLLGVTQVLANLKWDKELLKKIFTEDGKMLELPLLKEWFLEKEIKTRQAVILEAIEARFGTPAPADVSAAVRVVQDENKLKDFTLAAYTCATLEDFRRVLNLPQSPAN